MATVLFIKTEDLKRNTIISGSVDVDKFISNIKVAQQIHIQRYLGTDLYKRLQDGIVANDLTASESILLSDYLQDTLIYYAMSEYLPFAAIQVTNGGVFKHTPDNAVSVDKSEIDYLTAKYKERANYYTKRLVDYLCHNASSFPEYSTNTNNEISPTKRLDTGGWYLGDTGYDDAIRYRDLEL